MAMMDNANFLISHIRNSFITSDDTGMCEIIIENEEDRRISHTHRYDSSVSDSGMESSDNELSGSCDILPDMGYGHRLRSNTAQRLDRMKKEKRSQRKVKSIPWREGSASDFNADDRGFLFEKKSVQVVPQEPAKRVSKLTLQLENSTAGGDNPFLEYAKFDGQASASSTKKIDIFLTMANPENRAYPMPVVVMGTARIQDLIGLICWQYFNETREPKLNENIEMYALHIAEDDGEVDMDFPCLDSREPVTKFGFSKLALVEKDLPPPTSPKSAFVVTVYVPNRGFNKFQVENMNITLKEILNKIIKRRKIKIRPGLNYNLEKQNEPGTSLDLEATLASADTMEFCLVRENSTRAETITVSDETSGMAESLTSHQYKSFIVNMVHKLRANTEVQLGISGEKVEIDPVVGKGTAKFFKQRAVTHDADSIASCDIIEEKSTGGSSSLLCSSPKSVGHHRRYGKSVFRLTYLTGHDYKHHDFEADSKTAKEIVHKINNILELKLSPIRKEYVSFREKKSNRRSFRDSFTSS